MGRSRSHQAACNRKGTDTEAQGLIQTDPYHGGGGLATREGQLCCLCWDLLACVLPAGWQMKGWLAAALAVAWPAWPSMSLYMYNADTMILPLHAPHTLPRLDPIVGPHPKASWALTRPSDEREGCFRASTGACWRHWPAQSEQVPWHQHGRSAWSRVRVPW